jgi:hypothetical protein
MASTRTTLLTPRDIDILQSLDRCPLTARQLLKMSAAFTSPFTNERKVRARLQQLAACGRVRAWPLLSAGHGVPNYYTLSRRGYELLYGSDAAPPSKRAFRAVGLAHQQHTYWLAEFIVHTAVCAHRAGIAFTGFCRENTLRLEVGEEHLYPDCAFVLRTNEGQEFQFLVELDNRTERIRSDKDADSWQRKIRLYEALQDRSPQRFRVLAVATRSSHERTRHILDLAAELARNPGRSLFYGITLDQYLGHADALQSPTFLDHRGRQVPLVPTLPMKTQPNRDVPVALTTAALLRSATVEAPLTHV